ncbi:MAG TPA: DUF1461 domain-containing protein [Candidatus Nanoarchaeia archaeon]|nr:DUF1461 domain-containing protein [Candidatus Nanoarchaeia archaeon]
MKPHNYALVLLPLVIILSNFVIVLFSDGFYHDRFERYGTYDKLGKVAADAELDIIQSYFLGSEETLNSTLLTARERVHMLEVRDIMRKVLFLWLSVVLLFVVSAFLHPNWPKVLLWGGLAVVPLCLLLVFFSLNFVTSFIAFHELFFQDSSWLLASDSKLLILFPQELFSDVVWSLLLRSFFVGVVCSVGGWWLQRFKSPRPRIRL